LFEVRIFQNGSLLSKLGFSPQRREERKDGIFLFGGERPPNKKGFTSQYICLSLCKSRFWDEIFIPEGTGVCDPIASHDWITKANSPLRPLRLCGEPVFEIDRRSSKRLMKSSPVQAIRT
jgi:hypothetical protein